MRRTQRSPFQIPDDSSFFQFGANERKEQKEEMRKYLALPIGEKTSHAARMRAKLKNELVGEPEEEEEEKKRTLKQSKSNTGVTKQASGKRDLKLFPVKRENITKQSKYEFISMERQKAVLELSLIAKRSEILKMDRAIVKEEKQLRELEKDIEMQNQRFEEFLKENERKSVEARTLFEQEDKLKQEKNAEIKKLTAEIGIIKREIFGFEETLMDYKRYKDFLHRLSPPEWQEEQKLKALKAKKSSDKDREENQEVTLKNDVERKPSSSDRREAELSSAHLSDAGTDDSSDYEDDPGMYFTDPQQLLDLMAELTEQNLALIQDSARVEEKLEELQHAIEATRREIDEDYLQIKVQIDDVKQRRERERARAAKLQQKVQLHVSLSTEDRDAMLDALGEKVAKVHRSCVDDRMTNLSTFEKVADIESRMLSLLEGLESIPGETLENMRKIKESEKRTRQREEKLREQKEKQEERMKRYQERSFSDSKKKSGRKLVPRCMPIPHKVKVKTVEKNPAEDEIHEYLFGSDHTD
ncbi:cilia- and flagella-associated protein 100 isoform X2 [Oryzias melastigma]|uniref:Cilia and flagella associated protein 100 n=2 Tax=Oryzias melastigma TaxID=30732 RepID=A0A3B3CB39_ORYME|nr:cilia- and flagella-associated protein 100 isoform X2 [Oryzias melastigma]XP_036070008.1 cilia- and flagella-associated protein 100 isoform X2 [Oryzias melastigma]